MFTLRNTYTVCIFNSVSDMKALWLFKRQRLEDLPLSKASLSIISRITNGGHVGSKFGASEMTLKSLGPRLPRKQARPAPPDDDPAPQAMFSNQI